MPYVPPAVQPARVLVWFLHLAMPVAGGWLLLARPPLDVVWHDNAGHFWLVAAVAAVSLALGCLMSAAAHRHRDARLFLVSLTFLTCAGFFLLHALATPQVLIGGLTEGFDLAQPVGLAVASVPALVSALPLGRVGGRVLRARWWLWGLLAALLAGWAVASLSGAGPLGRPGTGVLSAPLVAVATTATTVYLCAAVLFYLLHRRRPAAVLLSLVTAFALLAETMVAVSLAPRWHLSWWEWHLLLSAGFGFVAYSAYVQYRREGSAAGIFDAVTLAETARQIRAEYGAALEEYVTALQRGDVAGNGAARLADRFGLTEGQTAVLERAGAALAVERDLARRLGALVAVGERARIGLGETEFLAAAVELLGRGFGEVHIGLMSDGVAWVADRAYPEGVLSAGPVRAGSFRGYPLMVKGRVAGVLEVGAHSAAAAGPELLRTVVDQVSIALENARLYRELGTLFRSYLSPDVAAALLADPGQARLGGSLVEVTALFADLRGFTAFSEDVEPAQIVTMLNRYHGVAVPCVLDNGGTIVQFVGDALLALFNAPARQSDHAVRAVRAALQLQAAVEAIAAGQPGWPRFRVGTNTGPALVGNIGSESLRGFNAMGDAVNVAARLQGLAEPGQVVAGHATVTRLGPGADVRELGELTVKGRRQTVRAYVVAGL